MPDRQPVRTRGLKDDAIGVAMQDFKPRHFPNRRPRNPGRLSWLARRRRRPLPKGFRPLAPPPRPGATEPRPGRVAPGLAWRMLRQPWLSWAYLGLAGWLLVGAAARVQELWQEPLQRVRVTGARTLSSEQVVQASGLTAGMRLGALDPYLVSLRLREDPRLEAADARRVYPGSVWIDVRERTPEMWVLLDGGRAAVVDRYNVVIRMQNAEPGNGPLIRGIRGAGRPGTVVEDAGLARARAFLAEAKAVGHAEFARAVLDVSDPGSIVVSGYGQGPRLVFPYSGMEEALRAYGWMAGGKPGAAVAPVLGAAREADFRFAAAAEGGRVFLRP